MKVKASKNKTILSLNRLEWLKIGAKTKWLKIAEPIEVDGKWYDEKNGELVEIDNPNAPKETKEPATPKSYKVEAYKITFTEGQEYANWYGIYKVLKINDNKTMDVEYLQAFQQDVSVGERVTYPILAQAETIFKANKRNEIEARLNRVTEFKEPDEYFTMGVLAAHGYVSAEIGPKYHKSFPFKYQKLTGEDPRVHLNKGYRLSPNEDRWSYTLRVHMPSDIPTKVLEKMKMPKAISRGEGIEINDNAFVWGLFNKGFRIGKNEDKRDQIAATLTADKKEAFLEGFNSF